MTKKIKHKDKYATVDSEKHISQLWGGDDGTGGLGRYTKLENITLKHLKKLLPQFKGGKVLEIGPGTGVLAFKMHQEYKIEKYTILDLEKNIKDSKGLLESKKIKANYVFSQDYKTLFSQKFDLIMSHYCLSEVPDYYRESLLENIMPKSKMAYIIDGDGLRKEYNAWLLGMFEKHYSKVSTSQVERYKNCLAMAGMKN